MLKYNENKMLLPWEFEEGMWSSQTVFFPNTCAFVDIKNFHTWRHCTESNNGTWETWDEIIALFFIYYVHHI